MKETELKYFFPYRIEKQHNFRNKLQNREAFFESMHGKLEGKYVGEDFFVDYNSDHLSNEDKCLNDYTCSLFLKWENWFKNGRNIFSFSKELLKMLEHTVVDDVTYKSLKLPYDSFYVSLRPLGLRITNCSDEIIEGVYVYVDSFAIGEGCDYAIGFCFVGDFEKFTIKNLGKFYPGFGFGAGSCWHYSLFFSEEENVITVSDSVNDTLNVTKNCLFSELEEYIPDEHRKFLYNHVCELINSTLKITINSILYLSMQKEDKDIATEYAKDLPFNFNRKLHFAKNAKETVKIEKKISEVGFSKIHYVGKSYTKRFKESLASNELLPHWRRGHWRNQPCGIERAESKLIWIKPTIVRKDKGEPQQGHIYDV